MKNILLTALLFLIFSACSSESDPESPPEMEEVTMQDLFFTNLKTLCGEVFSGEATYPEDPEDELVGVELTATVASCEENEIRIPFHAGADSSRTWVITRSEDGLHLRHDHRHSDGSPHELTDYGGYANREGTPTRQYFEADEHTVDMLPEAETNVWMLEYLEEEGRIIYYLERHDEARFRAALERKDR